MPSAKTKQNRESKTLTSRREEISEQQENKRSQLASTANKATEAPVLGWPARPWQPTMHRGCGGGETPREETSHRV